MNKFWLASFFGIGLSIWVVSTYLFQVPSKSNSSEARSVLPLLSQSGSAENSLSSPSLDSSASSREQSGAAIEYSTQQLPKSIVHILQVPTNGEFEIIPMTAEVLQPVRKFAEQTQAIAALNAGFFDPVNQKTTSYVLIGGQLVADPRSNERLMENPDLQSYLEQILNRSELRRYRCNHVSQSNHHPDDQTHPDAQTIRYDITRHLTPVPESCKLRDAIGAGPQLLPELTGEQEGFLATQDGAIVRDALGSRQPNARSAVGITADRKLVLVMAAQKRDAGTPAGVTLPEMAELLKSLGVIQAMNLDGGSSSSMYYKGQVFLGQYNRQGELVERPVKSVLLVRRIN